MVPGSHLVERACTALMLLCLSGLPLIFHEETAHAGGAGVDAVEQAPQARRPGLVPL